jgi:hypothetical protein
MKSICVISTLVMTLGLTAQASADNYVGSACSFADNPLAAHHKIHHRLVNTSGVGQWVTCPAVRRKTGSIGFAALYSSSGISSARVEIRTGGGSVLGWDAEAAPRSSTSGGFISDWFNFVDGTAGAGDQIVLEAFINNNAVINGYVVNEN